MTNQDSVNLSGVYEKSEKIKISLEGKKLEKVKNQASENSEQFWSEQAENILWFKKWDKILDSNPPFYKWFVGGTLNASFNCLDRHINTDLKNKAAVIWESETYESRVLTYYQLYTSVNKFANGLKNLGVKKGDCVTIYLPMVPELMIAMLACARIGAIHIVVFSGFSAQALSDRINDSNSKVVITADGGLRRGKLIELKKVVDQVIPLCPSIKHVIVLKRASNNIKINSKDVWWHDVIETQPYCEPEAMESISPLYILYTSGTTGKPKGVVHSSGGYLTYLYATAKWVFNFTNKDIFFCTADIGWVTGHSYIVYAPLMHGVTQIMYEGTPDYPQPDRYWNIVEKHGATILYTTPTALRMYIKFGDRIPNNFDLSSLRLLGTVGEPINPEVWMWYFKVIGKENCPIVDTWWQTETGGIMISGCTGIDAVPMKPGSGSFSLPGINAVVVDESGNPVDRDKKGYLVITRPWPGMLTTLWNDKEKYQTTYWKKFDNNIYFTGDYALYDIDGYIWLLGRADDVLKISGHRLGTMELESAFVSHRAIAEAAVTSRPDEKKGDSIIAFLVKRTEFNTLSDQQLRIEITSHIRDSVGPIATPGEIYFVNKLPKTRSGKIMRRLLKSISSGSSTIGDLSTLEDGTSIEEVRQAYSELHEAIK
ncbi:acetate--CoA ligase [Nitrososphaera sp. AFS]|uniref:acetate--CoA ligase n=1 Tax=Nitrososphaera sp. AFS TaxID=2301191 RepID=UPI0013923630|nr:acetate--CoA ligase [Nitrososphaera sp. AFS]NAL78033.1 acetate--CoA ligase [Nitrososphaera sp. AFS]